MSIVSGFGGVLFRPMSDQPMGRITPTDFSHIVEHPMYEALPALPAALPATKRWWSQPVAYDQGQTNSCTAYAFCQAMTAVVLAQTGEAWAFDPGPVFVWAQQHDGIVGPHEGSTVKAAFEAGSAIGADELIDGQDGLDVKLATWVWTQSAVDVVNALLTTGPVVIGVGWLQGMMVPDGAHIIHATGAEVGGHAVLVQGVDTELGFVTIKNQWLNWGWPGPDPTDALLSISDLGVLLAADGEACLAIVTTK
jgi:hypothetical protein